MMAGPATNSSGSFRGVGGAGNSNPVVALVHGF